MKKLLSLLLLVMAVVVPFTANATKTITLKAGTETDTPVVNFRNPNNQYIAEPVTAQGVTVSVADNASIPLFTEEGYKIVYIWSTTGYNVSPDQSDYTIDCNDLTSGAEVNIVVAEQAASDKSMVTFRGDPGAFYVSYNYQSGYADASGVYAFEQATWDATATVYAASDEYTLVSVTDELGNTTTPVGGCAYVSVSASHKNPVYTVVTTSASSGEKGEFTVTVSGSAYKVSCYDSAYNYYYFDNDTPVKMTYTAGNKYVFISQYSALYKIKINGETVATGWTRYEYTPVTGDQIEIETDFPEVPVKLNVNVAEGSSPDVIKRFQVNYNEIPSSEWANGYNLTMGQNVSLEFNSSDFTNAEVKLNGEVIYTTGNNPYYNFAVADEVYTLDISGTPQKPFTVTIATDDYEHLIVRNASYEQLTLTGEETVLEISASNSPLIFSVAPDYELKGIYQDGNEVSSNYVYINSDTYIEAEVAPIVRDLKAAVYVGTTGWNYLNVTIAANNYDLRKEFDLSKSPGYNFIDFREEDVPFNISGAYGASYAMPILYLDGVELENQYGAYAGLENIKNNSVIKLFGSTPESYSVDYTVSDDVAVEVRHDHLQVIDNPSSHSVFAGTAVHIVPVSTGARANNQIAVKVNGVEVQPDEDGIYAITVDGHKSISVDKALPAGINAIEAGEVSSDAPVYNLQGIRVATAAKAAELPAGIYIIEGKKYRF